MPSKKDKIAIAEGEHITEITEILIKIELKLRMS
jgi:hypothetical protein